MQKSGVEGACSMAKVLNSPKQIRQVDSTLIDQRKGVHNRRIVGLSTVRVFDLRISRSFMHIYVLPFLMLCPAQAI